MTDWCGGRSGPVSYTHLDVYKRQELQRSEREAQSERKYLQSLYHHMPLGYAQLRVIRDRQGKPVDLSNYHFLTGSHIRCTAYYLYRFSLSQIHSSHMHVV